MRWLENVFRLMTCAAVGGMLAVLPATPAAADDPPVTVTGDRSVFLVRGSQPLGQGSGTSTSTSGPPCAGCASLLTPICVVDRFGQPPSPGQPCIEIVDFCPRGRFGRQAWTSDGRGGWVPGGRRCWREDPGISLSGVTSQLAARLHHRVAKLRPGRQPFGHALVGLPVVFTSGQVPGPRTWNDKVAGFAVTITVSPRWRWTFGDGTHETTTRAGGRWPDMSVAHPYPSAGTYLVICTTTWDGTFTVDGAGTFPIAGAVSQQAALRVPVRPARALLVPG